MSNGMRSASSSLKVMTVFGTRPEGIKMAPIIRELERRSVDGSIRQVVCSTGQHREMLDQVLSLFGIVPDYDLDVMKGNQSPTQVAAAVISKLEPILQAEKPDWVLVQGDTTTVAAASLAAFYARAKVGHVEAGLRTYDKWQPFPEEVNRRVAGVIADLHFAPTDEAAANLRREGVRDEQILVTGNTVIDAVRWAATQPAPDLPLDGRRERIENAERLILVTAHRRESFGKPLEDVCLALRDLAERYGELLQIVYPVHLNPNVQGTARRVLGDVPNVTLLPPLDYLPLVHLMKRVRLVLTDSGGIQEEAPALGKPVLVLRDVTERPEGVAAGTVRLVGTDRERIVAEAARLLDEPAAYERMARAVNPYGDGRAAERIVRGLLGEQVEPFGKRLPAGQLVSA